MSSAAMVSRRMRLSAKARSSGILGSRWWQTISISRCSSTVFIVKGRVGLVDDGQDIGLAADLDDIRRVAAAGAFSMEGVNGAPLEGGNGCSRRNRTRSGCRCGWPRRYPSLPPPQGRCRWPPAWSPQSSCSFNAQAPAAICSRKASGLVALPLPKKPRVHGKSPRQPGACARCARARASPWWRWCPSAGPVPPPSMVVTPE